VQAVVTDPPYGLSQEPDIAEVLRHWLAGDDYRHRGGGFMGKSWDSFVPGPSYWRAAYDLLPPGGHLLCFAGTRTVDLMGIAIRMAGFEIRDQIQWLYGCLDERTEAVTPRGIMPYHKLKEGDLVLCYDPAIGGYGYQPVQEIVEYDYSDTAYRLVGDFGEQVVSRNHRCIVERDGAEVFVPAEEAAREREVRVPFLESLPELQSALSGARQGAGCAQQDVRPGLHGSDDFRSQCGEGEAGGSAQGQGPAGLLGVRQSLLPECQARSAGGATSLQQAVQRSAAWRGMEGTRPQGARSLEAGERSGSHRPLYWADQPFVEGWAHLSEAEGRLRGPADQVRALSRAVRGDGSQGRLCDGAQVSSDAGDREAATPRRVRPSQEPQGDGQPAAELDVVRHERRSQGVRAWRGHKTTVVRVVPFHYAGKVWCLRVPTGAFVAVRGGVAFPTGNSGFPKSLDVSKAIDKAGGVDAAAFKADLRAAVACSGMSRGEIDAACGFTMRFDTAYGADPVGWGVSLPSPEKWRTIAEVLSIPAGRWAPLLERVWRGRAGDKISDNDAMSGANFVRSNKGAPATDTAHQWSGFGTALKPAHEPIIVARRPLDGTVAQNVLAHGAGAINVDACRVGIDVVSTHSRGANGAFPKRPGEKTAEESGRRQDQREGLDHSGRVGRWPANVVWSKDEDEYILRNDLSASERSEVYRWLSENP
jgi:hypothetical protein